MNSKIWLSSPHMGGNEQNYINQAFDANWIAPLGPNVTGFEEDLENYLVSDHVAALNSGTAAIHLALLQCGVNKGDEVLCQSFTFCGSSNPIKYIGAKPIFIDSESETWNIAPVLLEEAIKDRLSKGKKPKAIIVVHLYGMPCKLDEIIEISKTYSIPVIEDAAEALGSTYNNQKCGTFTKYGILSFNGNKIITTSGGGALVCPSEDSKRKSIFLATQARDNAAHYQHSEIGYNYRLSNICAGIGRGQMEVIDERVQQRRAMNIFYRDIFQEKEGITFQNEPNSIFFSNYWLTGILINSNITGFTNLELKEYLDAQNIETRPLWKPMHLQPVHNKDLSFTNGVSERLFTQGLCLPSGSNLNSQQMERIRLALINFLNANA